MKWNVYKNTKKRKPNKINKSLEQRYDWWLKNEPNEQFNDDFFIVDEYTPKKIKKFKKEDEWD